MKKLLLVLAFTTLVMLCQTNLGQAQVSGDVLGSHNLSLSGTSPDQRQARSLFVLPRATFRRTKFELRAVEPDAFHADLRDLLQHDFAQHWAATRSWSR